MTQRSGLQGLNTNVCLDIENERYTQMLLYGTEEDLVNKHGIKAYLDRKMVILMEETGELAKDINDMNEKGMYNEAIQTAAVAQAICEGIDYFLKTKLGVK